MSISASDLGAAFPEIKPGVRPFGQRVLVQMRVVREKTAGGIILAKDTKDANRDLGQMGKVVAMGQIAYCNRDTGKPWSEGAWCKVGDYVRVIRYGGDRFRRQLGDGEHVEFVMLNDHEVYAGVDTDAFEELDEIL